MTINFKLLTAEIAGMFAVFALAGIINVFISADELSQLRGFFGLVHRDSSRKEAEKTFLFPCGGYFLRDVASFSRFYV